MLFVKLVGLATTAHVAPLQVPILACLPLLRKAHTEISTNPPKSGQVTDKWLKVIGLSLQENSIDTEFLYIIISLPPGPLLMSRKYETTQTTEQLEDQRGLRMPKDT